MTVLVETRDVCKSFGPLCVLDRVTMAVHDGELVSIVGPNGAGKTTLVNLLTGLIKPTSGVILFRGRNVAGIGPVELANHGMARAFQLIEIFPKLTVAETLAVAIVSRPRWPTLSACATGSARSPRRCHWAKKNCSMSPPPLRSNRS